MPSYPQRFGYSALVVSRVPVHGDSLGAGVGAGGAFSAVGEGSAVEVGEGDGFPEVATGDPVIGEGVAM